MRFTAFILFAVFALDLTAAHAACDATCQAGFVTEHNRVRTRVNDGLMPAPGGGFQPIPAPPLGALTLDNTIAGGSQTWADGCNFVHATSGFGENLYASAGSAPTPAAAVTDWESESGSYTYAAIGDPINNGAATGHYTQLVWANTSLVGCGVAHCTTNSPFMGFPEWDLVVCRYSPAGNFTGQFPYVRASNANLSGLTISAGTLTPPFASATLAYTDAVSNATAAVTVTPTAAAAGSTIQVNGNTVASGTASGSIGLNVGSGNVINVVVTAQGGATMKTYTITVTRAAAGTAPSAPTAVSAIAGATSIVVKFGAPANNGGAAITGYGATCSSSNGGAAGTMTGNGSATSIRVGGLTNGKTYMCTVTASNSVATGPASAPTNAVMPFDTTPILFQLLD